MGKHGPCRHCGVTSTPLWRNGPPEKPVLCNACGSRWRTKGSLTNYTPMHARELIDPEMVRVSKVKGFTFNPKERKSPKKKQSNGAVEFEREMQMPYSDQNFRKILEEDTSNRSSSGSAISYSESCAYFGYTDVSDLTGSAQSNVWESLVPSKKRTCVTRPRPSPVEKLTKDLCSILHEQRSSYLSGSSEEDLLYESETPVGSVEIGHGGVLIRNPNSKTVEEESEASSLPVDNKSYIVNERYSGSASVSVHSESKGPSSLYVSTEKYRKPMSQVEQDYVKRDKVSHDKFSILQNRGSPLGSMDLTDVVNFEKFMDLLTHEEQKRLMKFLPSVDSAKHSESLKSMFNSPQFKESLSYFQQLLLEGIFDLSFPGTNIEECRTLKKIVLLNLMKSRWVEPYNQLKVVKCKQITVGKGVSTGLNSHEISKMISLKRPRDSQHQSFSDVKGSMRSPKRVSKSCGMNPPSSYIPQLDSSNKGSKSNQCTDDSADNEGACFSPRSLFALPPDRSSILVSLQFTDDSADQDLLLDVPCNAPLPEAELLYHPWKQKVVPISSTAENGVLDGEESLSNFPSSSSTSK